MLEVVLFAGKTEVVPREKKDEGAYKTIPGSTESGYRELSFGVGSGGRI